jgi:hypothetical protein
MNDCHSIVERAFDLAKRGRVKSLSELRTTLRMEGFIDQGHLYGRSIKDQRAKLIKKATAEARK